VIADWLPTRLRAGFTPREPLPETLRYLFVLGPPLSRVVRLNIHGDRIDVDPTCDESGADAVLTLDAETYILLMMGRLNWKQVLDAGAAGVTGRRDLARDLPSWFGLT